MRHEIDRRALLAAGAALGATAALTAVPGTAYAAGSVPPGGSQWSGGDSANGWPVLEEARLFRIEGSGQSVRLADGDAAVILLHVARRFHYELDPLRPGDVRGHSTNRSVAQEYESNHLSGTALAIRPHAYPVGVKGGLYPRELVVIRDILAELNGAVAWGGDFGTPKESHFEIAYQPGHPKVTGVARTIRGWREGPGNEGAGTVDAFALQRRRQAAAFARRSAQGVLRK
ncbi:M15 family metallopeptidase [Streptomyces sp. NPDC006923]|uniref:M15 family metallopeptidase n=1 Tax=Streptomyces sp. NPDC006923 TaxID=3155355 RepID=UPI0033E8F844